MTSPTWLVMSAVLCAGCATNGPTPRNTGVPARFATSAEADDYVSHLFVGGEVNEVAIGRVHYLVVIRHGSGLPILGHLQVYRQEGRHWSWIAEARIPRIEFARAEALDGKIVVIGRKSGQTTVVYDPKGVNQTRSGRTAPGGLRVAGLKPALPSPASASAMRSGRHVRSAHHVLAAADLICNAAQHRMKSKRLWRHAAVSLIAAGPTGGFILGLLHAGDPDPNPIGRLVHACLMAGLTPLHAGFPPHAAAGAERSFNAWPEIVFSAGAIFSWFVYRDWRVSRKRNEPAA